MNKGTLNRILKAKGLDQSTEVTRHKGTYYLLHICKNGTPVPMVYSKDIATIQKEALSKKSPLPKKSHYCPKSLLVI